MSKKIYITIIVILISFIIALAFLYYNYSKEEYSYIITTEHTEEGPSSIPCATTTLFVFKNNICISEKIYIKFYDTTENIANFSYEDVYSAILDAEESNVARILSYSKEKKELVYERALNISRTKEEVKEFLSENAKDAIVEF